MLVVGLATPAKSTCPSHKPVSLSLEFPSLLTPQQSSPEEIREIYSVLYGAFFSPDGEPRWSSGATDLDGIRQTY